MESEKKWFGDVSLVELLEAQDRISRVIDFIKKNKDSEDKDTLSNARFGLALICMQELLIHGTVTDLARTMGDGIERELGCDQPQGVFPKSISIPIPTGEKS